MWQISIETTTEAAEAVGEWLANRFGQPAAIYDDFKTGTTTVSLYCEANPSFRRPREDTLREGLNRIKACGLKIGSRRVRVRQIRREQWAESWKRHFKPIEIGTALLLRPSWSRRRPRRGQAVIVLDPGLSFGTGQHPTTAFCLRELAGRRRPREIQSFLDIGTGSGILAIAAAKLGYNPIQALDCDPESVRVARANARANRVLAKVRITREDLTRLPFPVSRPYDIVCANLTCPLLVAERKRIAGQLGPDGTLVLAGILKSEFREVRQAYAALGLHLVRSSSRGEWQSGTLRRDCRNVLPKSF